MTLLIIYSIQFERQNEDTIDKLHTMTNEIALSQDQLTLETKSRLKEYLV